MNHAILQEDVTRLAVAEFANSGQDLSLRIVDLGGKSDVINTQFKIKYRAQDNFVDSFNAQTEHLEQSDGDCSQRGILR